VHNKINSKNLTEKKLTALTRWLCTEIKLPIASMDIIFTDDEILRDLHEKFLDDKEYTDVMTFNLGTESAIEGEIYISIDRALENALKYHATIEDEICRLIIHGCLHLAGYEDNNKLNQRFMKEKEENFLTICSKKFLY
jgi:rRNA maturation RNase YbeY